MILNAIKSLQKIDHQFPMPEVVHTLLSTSNIKLLEYVSDDAFGAHVFPGNLSHYSREKFLHDLNVQLGDFNPIHLWVNLPLCEQRCFFCQFPIAISRNSESRQAVTQKWLDANLREAALWLHAVPNLRHVPIGEFNILGGTPTLFSNKQLEQLVAYYKQNFCFQSSTTIRIEGTASTFTMDKLEALKRIGITKVSAGVQSFNHSILKQANCIHTNQDAIAYIQTAKQLGFKSVNADFIYGLLDQHVDQFLQDIKTAIAMEVSCIVITKLHLKSFANTRTAVSGEKDALWQTSITREQIEKKGHHWPTLGEQYQMREEAVKLLTQHGYRERPTMYFYHPNAQPERWKSLVVDQDKQYAEVGIGMGASSNCLRSEAINATRSTFYFEQLNNGMIPIESIQGFDDIGVILKSLKMALSTCQPLINEYVRRSFPQQCLFQQPWKSIFTDLENRSLVTIDRINQTISLTSIGKTLIEAIIHTELYP